MNENEQYYTAVFKNNSIRDWAKRAANMLGIKEEELKVQNMDKFRKKLGDVLDGVVDNIYALKDVVEDSDGLKVIR